MMGKFKNLIAKWHDKPDLFCVYCAMNKLHVRRFYLKEPVSPPTQTEAGL